MASRTSSSGCGLGSFWSKFLSILKPKARKWDRHGLSDNVVLDIDELREFKKYKVSDVTLIDNLTSKSIDGDDPINKLCTLEPGGIYTKSQLQEKLQDLIVMDDSFETLDIKSKTKPDGTIGITISFVEYCWSASAYDSVKFINVGLMDPRECTTWDKEPQGMSIKKYLREEVGCTRRIDMSRPCMLPASTQKEILDMLVGERQLTLRLLIKIQEKVTRWYKDRGYEWASVVDFGNLDSRELVFEVVEGDITHVVVQFQDELGNAVSEEKPQYEDVRKVLRKYISQGKVFNRKEANQAVADVKSLGLFSEVVVEPSPDEKNEGGVLIEIKLKEMEQQPA